MDFPRSHHPCSAQIKTSHISNTHATHEHRKPGPHKQAHRREGKKKTTRQLKEETKTALFIGVMMNRVYIHKPIEC